MAKAPKTQPSAASVADFLGGVDEKRRADVHALNTLLEEVSGEKGKLWGAAIVGFGSYRSSTGDWPIVGFSPRKANLVVYLMNGYEEAGDLLARLGKHKIGKSCLYLNRLADVDRDVLRALVERSVATMRRRAG